MRSAYADTLPTSRAAYVLTSPCFSRGIPRSPSTPRNLRSVSRRSARFSRSPSPCSRRILVIGSGCQPTSIEFSSRCRYPSESATLTRSNSSISRLKSLGSQRSRLTRPVITVDGRQMEGIFTVRVSAE